MNKPVAVPGPGERSAGATQQRARRADPVATEIVRQALNSAATQMQRALVRTAFSPIIYEALDFAVAIHDRRIRLLAQSASLPLFMGTMGFCVDAAVREIGGEEKLEPGDILLYNDPYGSGSHPQDAAVVMPVFLDDLLIGYTSIKGHLLDIGGKEPFATDTVDVFQEGVIFPAVKLYRRGELVEDIARIISANSRIPKAAIGDISAEVVGVRAGAAALERIARRYGLEMFDACVEDIFDHGEAVIRGYLENIPDGSYRGSGLMDSNGITDEMIPLEVTVTVEGSDVRVDFSDSPDQQAGPVNCPLPSTISATRVAIALFASGGEAPNEGQFRAIEVITRPGSIYHPLPPAPVFMYWTSALQGMEAIFQALAPILPDVIPACSGGDILAVVWWGLREQTGEPWGDGFPMPVGHGASSSGDGLNAVMHHGSAGRITPVEVVEAKNPWLVERLELAAGSGGLGRHRGGLGIEFHVRALEEMWITPAVERTKTGGWGLQGGTDAQPNRVAVRHRDGTVERIRKATRLNVPKGSIVEITTGGGGGHGPLNERPDSELSRDLDEGYVTAELLRAPRTEGVP